MNAQIIPFQTKTHRTLALARAWYYCLKDDYAKQGLIIDRKTVIEDAVVEALVEQYLGRRYWERDSVVAEVVVDEWRKIARREICTGWLQCWLDRWLHGKFLPVKKVPPRRPRCSKATRKKPAATVIPLQARCAESNAASFLRKNAAQSAAGA